MPTTQPGIGAHEARAIAEKAGLLDVEDRCLIMRPLLDHAKRILADLAADGAGRGAALATVKFSAAWCPSACGVPCR
jgi:hypothetical protein